MSGRPLPLLSKQFSDLFLQRNVERFALDNQRVRYLTEEEENRLYDAIGDDHLLRDVVTIALNTGMRRGEIFNLKWFDVDFGRGLLQVRKTKTKLNRTVPMNTRVREVLNLQPRTRVCLYESTNERPIGGSQERLQRRPISSRDSRLSVARSPSQLRYSAF